MTCYAFTEPKLLFLMIFKQIILLTCAYCTVHSWIFLLEAHKKRRDGREKQNKFTAAVSKRVADVLPILG